MTAKVAYNVVILFEDEVRAAARLMAGLFAEERSLSADEAIAIIKACHCALQGAEVDDALLLLGRKPSPAGRRTAKPKRLTA